MKNNVIEIVKVKLKPGTDEKTYMEQGKNVHEHFLSKQLGFIKRLTLKSPEGQWVDLVWWENLEDAQKASQKLMTEPSESCLLWMQMMDETCVNMWHGRIIGTYYDKE